jgi:hypothetical protein
MGILSWLFGEREPLPEPIDHPTLGRLEPRPEGWWEGKRSVGGELDLEFCIAGDKEGPAPALVSPLERTLEDWSTVESKIRLFIEPRIVDFPEASVDDFSPTCLLYLWPNRPQYFMVDLSMRGDEYGIWKVEFDNGVVKYWSRDD